MPARMSNAFNRSALADPNQLDPILEDLDRVRAGISDNERLSIPCGQ
jgi:alpha-glucoside transport system substrate-binding protein